MISITWGEGRIGETLEECMARYGEPVRIEEPFERYRGSLSGFHEFKSGDLKVLCQFDAAGRCLYLTYYKVAVQPQQGVQKLSPEESNDLFEQNGAGQKWLEREGKNRKDA